jgi:hypothetical protein
LRKNSDRRDWRPLGLKPIVEFCALYAALKPPLFHGTTGIQDIQESFRND